MDRQFPGIRRVLAFFGEAGIRTELSEQGCFWINGGQAPPLASLVRHTSTGIAWDDIIDQIAMTYARRELINAVWDNARFGNSVRVFLRPEDNEFAIMSGDAKLAAIRATGAHFPQHDVIKANFLTAGPHWQQAVRAVREAESRLPAESEREQAAKFDALAAAAAAAARRRAAEESAKAAEWERDQKAKADALAAAAAARRRAAEESAKAADKADEKAPERRWTNARRLISGLPDSLPAQLVDACLAASQRIRLERQLAYERPVILQYPLGELTLWPVAGSGTRLVVPFQFKEGPRTIKADLILGSRDPLAVLIGESVGQGTQSKHGYARCSVSLMRRASTSSLLAAHCGITRRDHHSPQGPRPFHASPRCQDCHRSGVGPATCSRSAIGSATAARWLLHTGGYCTTGGPRARTQFNARTRSESSSVQTKRGSEPTLGVSPTTSRCASGGVRLPNSAARNETPGVRVRPRARAQTV